MPTGDPKLWGAVVAICTVVSGGGTAGVNWILYDPVLAYRVDQCEDRTKLLRQDITVIQSQIEKLPSDYWRNKIEKLESTVKMQNDALIRLENHGHPELKYKQAYPQ